MKWSFNKAARRTTLLLRLLPSGAERSGRVDRVGEFRAKAQYSFGGDDDDGRNFTAAANFAPVVAAEEEKEERERGRGRGEKGLHFE